MKTHEGRLRIERMEERMIRYTAEEIERAGDREVKGEIDGVRPRDTAAAASSSADATSGSERRDMMEGDAANTAREPMPRTTTTNDNDNDFRHIRTDSDCASDTIGSPQGERLDTSMDMGIMGCHPFIKPESDVSVPCHLVVDEDDPYFQCFHMEVATSSCRRTWRFCRSSRRLEATLVGTIVNGKPSVRRW